MCDYCKRFFYDITYKLMYVFHHSFMISQYYYFCFSYNLKNSILHVCKTMVHSPYIIYKSEGGHSLNITQLLSINLGYLAGINTSNTREREIQVHLYCLLPKRKIHMKMSYLEFMTPLRDHEETLKTSTKNISTKRRVQMMT